MNYDNYFVLYLFIFAVVPDDDQLPQHEQDNIPPRSCTPPTPPVEADQPSPPPLPPPVRPRAMGQLRPCFNSLQAFGTIQICTVMELIDLSWTQ